MYKIVYMHKDSNDENLLWQAGDQEYCLTSCKLDIECGKSGTLTMGVPEANPAKYEIEFPTDEIIVYQDEKEIWRGRPVTEARDFYNTGTLTCEGILSYLYDTYLPPFEFEGSPEEFLRMVLDNHNSLVEDRKKFELGEITVVDPNNYINRSSIYYNRSLTVLTEKLVNESLGGYFRVRVEDGTRYLDYLESYATQASQPVEFGENLLDISQNIEYTDTASVILPLGARLEDEDGMQTDEYTTIASVNGGSIYYIDEAALERYGWICVCNEWEDVTVPSNLLDRAKTYLEQCTNAISNMSVNAVDLSLIYKAYEAIQLGDYVYIDSAPHGIKQYVELTAMTIYPMNPENDVLTFGSDTASITSSQRNTDRQVQTALGSLSMRVTNLTADVINAVYANIEEIVAQSITADVIRAAVADLGYVTADWVEANFANIDYLEANYASLLDLDVALGNIELLNADVVNINNLLAGNAGTGDLQTIVLTTANATIDSAVIIDALINEAIIGDLIAGKIYTDYVQIANNEGENLLIDGATIQINDGNAVRVQIGLDADGNYNFYIFSSDGSVIWDALGLTEAGLIGNGAIIRDVAVADDANISGYKLNIDEVTQILNENGDLILSATQVTIDGSTLDYKMSEITQNIQYIESDGVKSVENYYALGGPDEPPCDPGDTISEAILGEMILGEAILGCIGWTTERLVAGDGEYLWYCQKITYIDGTETWTTPTLITDDYLRNLVVSAYTELQVVEGQISAKVWETDIENAVNSVNDEITTLTDKYGEVTVQIDMVDARVGALTTTVDTYYMELSSQISAVTIDLDSITAEVRDVYERTANAITEGTPYYAVSTNPDYYPPHEVEDNSSILGEMILGQAILGFSGTEWTTDQPVSKEGQYIWLSYYRTRADGSTYWTEPTLLTDDFLRLSATQMSERYAEILVNLGGISAEVANIQADLGTNYSTVTEVKALIEEAVSDSKAEILLDVSYGYVSEGTFTDTMKQYYTSVETEARISAVASEEIAKISLSVSGGSLGSTAMITMTADGSTIASAGIDLEHIREAFANDDTAITIAAGTIGFYSNTFICDSDYFKVTAEGELTCTKGTIGGWVIGTPGSTLKACIYYNRETYDGDYSSGTYIGADGIKQGTSDHILAMSDGDIYLYQSTFTPSQPVGGSYPRFNAHFDGGTIYLYPFGYAVNDAAPTGKWRFNAYELSGFYTDQEVITNASRSSSWFSVNNVSELVKINGTLTVNGSTVSGSDESLKNNISPLKTMTAEDYEKIVDTLEPVSFEYKSDEQQKKHIGFTYQNAVEALKAGGVDPDDSAMAQMVTNPDTGESYGGIEYNDIVALLVYEVQKLKKEIQEMKGE